MKAVNNYETTAPMSLEQHAELVKEKEAKIPKEVVKKEAPAKINPVKDLTIPVDRVPDIRIVDKDNKLYQFDQNGIAGDFRLRYVGKLE